MLDTSTGATVDRDTLITVSDDEPRRLDPAVYSGINACGRPPWEHRLRKLLELDDPCFR